MASSKPFVASKLDLPLSYAYTGVLQGLAGMLLPFLFVCGFFWMASAIFKHAAFIKAILGVGGIEIARGILNRITGMAFPSLSEYLNQLAGMSRGSTPELTSGTLASLGGADSVIQSYWLHTFDAYTWQRILFIIIFFGVGYWFYRKREIA